jgi:glycosyltransferase involved in cell wall biosynthesis
MKIIAFVGETFSDYKNKQYTKPTSIAFLQDTFGIENVYAASPSIKVTDKPESYSSVVDAGQFYAFPHYSSTKQFFINSIFKRGFYKNYLALADKIILENKGEYFWIRTPSIGSIVFGLRALKAKQKVLHHMCADASNTWRDNKYKGLHKVMAFLISRYIRFLLKKICSNENTTNFCTGDVLESFSKKYSPNKTHQFVDVMVKDTKDVKQSEQKSNGLLNILFVGRMVEDKGIFDLIRVVEQLNKRVRLTLVGDGPDLIKAQKLVADLKLNDKINFTGQLAHSALSQLFLSSDVIAVPSNNNYEGFPRVIMEAWSFNKPVIVSNVGGVNAFVKNQVNGLIIKPGSTADLHEALLTCLNDLSMFDAIQQGAKDMAIKSIQSYWINVLVSNTVK